MEQLSTLVPKEIIPALLEFKVFDIENAKISEWKGHRFLPGFNAENVKYAYEEWNIPENAVFLHTFPKTGTHWTGEILRQVLYSRDEKLDQLMKSIPIELFGIEFGPLSKFQLLEQVPIPRKCFFSHLSEEVFNFEKMKQKGGKMIYVIRNPKDQAVSWFHYTKHLKALQIEFGEDWNTFLDNYIQGKHPLSSKPGEWYPENIRGWLKHKDDKDFLLLVYEDMKKDLPKQVRRIAKFLDVELTDDDVNQIADKCSFSSLKKSLKDAPVDATRNLARKGEVGGWKDYFTVAQSEMMDKIMVEKLGDAALEFIYTL